MMETSLVVDVVSMLAGVVSATVAILIACQREKIEVKIFLMPVVYTVLDHAANRLRRGWSSTAHAPRVGHAGPAGRDPEPIAAD